MQPPQSRTKMPVKAKKTKITRVLEDVPLSLWDKDDDDEDAMYKPPPPSPTPPHFLRSSQSGAPVDLTQILGQNPLRHGQTIQNSIKTDPNPRLPPQNPLAARRRSHALEETVAFVTAASATL